MRTERVQAAVGARVGLRKRGLRAGAVVVLGGLAGGSGIAGVTDLGAGVARGATRSASAITRSVRYLEGAENRDGGFGAAAGQSSAPLYTGWAALGLASAGVDLSTLRRGPGDETVLSSLQHETAGDTGSLERTALALRAAGDLQGARTLAARLRPRFSARGALAGQVNLTAFGLLTLRAAALPGSAGLQVRAAAWLAGQADRDGGYGFAGRGSSSDADDTGAVLEALGGVHGAAVARARRGAVAYLRGDQDRDGGFPALPGAGSNSESTAWAVQGLIAAGVSPAGVHRPRGASPIAYLTGLVGAGGAIAYARGEHPTPVWVTGEVLMALTGRPLPLLGWVGATRSAPTGSGSTPTTRSTTTSQSTRTTGTTPATAGGAGATRAPATGTTTSARTRTARATTVASPPATSASTTVSATTASSTPAAAVPTSASSRPQRALATGALTRVVAAAAALPGRLLAAARLG